MKSPIKYHSALRNIDDEELIDINDAKSIGSIFYCPYCKGEMVPRCGEHNEWHFAHKRRKCSYDKYLHSLAELKILKWISESQKIILSLPYKKTCSESTRCVFYKRDTCTSESKKKFNLKEYYGQCEKEKEITIGEKSFVPDLLWHYKKGESEPLFIEIFVSHPCSKEKMGSGVRIIEFRIKSEKDIDRIIGSTIQECDRVRLYNFKPLKDEVGDTPSEPINLHKYTIFPSHKTFLDFHCICRDVPSLSGNKSYTSRRGFFEISYRNEFDEQIHNEGGMEVIGMAYASQYDKSLKHCNLCKNQTYFDGSIICRLLKERGSRFLNCKDASKCPDFQRNEDIINRRIEILNQYRQTHFVDVWVNNKEK